MNKAERRTFLRQFFMLLLFGTLVVVLYWFMQVFVFNKYGFVHNEKIDSELSKQGVCDSMHEHGLQSVLLKKTSEYKVIYDEGREVEGMLSVMGAVTFRNTNPQQAYFEIKSNAKKCEAWFIDLYEKYPVAEAASFMAKDYEHIIESINYQKKKSQ